MNSLEIEVDEARAQWVNITKDSLVVELTDGRTIISPLAWYPRLLHSTNKERLNFEIIGDGSIIHWEDVDEDLSVSGIVLGRRSGESQESFERWLKERETQALS